MSQSVSKYNPAAFVIELWRQRELLWQFAQREVQLRHKGSHLGLIWSLLNPLLMLGLYVFVFGYIYNTKFGVLRNESQMDYGLGIFLGLSLFQFLAETAAISLGLIVANPNFVKKVVFPLEILPAATVLSAGFHMLISLTLVLLGVAIFGVGLTAGVLWLPVIVLPIALLALGIAWTLAAVGVFLRDLNQVVGFLTLVLMYASAIFFPASRITEPFWHYLRFNPLLLAVELARDAVLWDRAINGKHLGYLYVLGFIACYLGQLIFRRLKPAFADVL